MAYLRLPFDFECLELIIALNFLSIFWTDSFQYDILATLPPAGGRYCAPLWGSSHHTRLLTRPGVPLAGAGMG
jgi:hypothetical protein